MRALARQPNIVSHETTDPRLPRRTLTTAGACHVVHDGYTDVLYVFIPLWAIAFDMSLTETGWLLSIYLLVMGIGQLPVGLLGERYGERSLLVAGTALAGIAFVGLGTAESYGALITLMLVAGIGSAVQHPLSSSLVSSVYPASGRRIALATYNFSGDLGKVTFPFIAAILIGFWSWRTASVTLGLIGIGLAFLVGNVLRRLNIGGGNAALASKGFELRTWGIHERFGFSVLTVIYVLDMIVRAGFLLLLPFCLIGKSLPDEKVGFALTALFLGGAAGKYLVGRFAQWQGVLPAVFLSEGLTAVGILAVLFLPLSTALWLLPLVGAALNGTSSVLYGSVAEFVNENKRARAFGLFYTVGVAASALAPTLSGVISDEIGLENAIIIVAVLATTTIPLAVLLRPALRRAEALAG